MPAIPSAAPANIDESRRRSAPEPSAPFLVETSAIPRDFDCPPSVFVPGRMPDSTVLSAASRIVKRGARPRAVSGVRGSRRRRPAGTGATGDALWPFA